MGNAAGKTKGAISDPFPVSQRLSKDLDKLSFVAARILSTPDIYDVNNLAKPGVCGDYAVFLKKGLEKKLLPFIATDTDGTLMEVVYQNPRKAIDSLEKRKKICGDMVDTMLRAIATVVACLASIQVATQARETAVAGVPKQQVQVGGDVRIVRDWLQRAGYISGSDAAKPAGTPMNFQVPGIPASSKFQYKLTLERTENYVTHGLISVDSKSGISDPLPTGYLRVQFLNFIPLPIPGSTNKTALPIRILDNSPIPWAAGILYESVFKSFSERTPQIYVTELFERLFRKTQGVLTNDPETRETVTQANDVFHNLRKSGDPQILIQSLGRWFSEHVPGFQAGYQPPGAPAYYGQPALPYGQPQLPYGMPQVPAYGIPQAPAYGYGAAQPLRPLQPTATRYGVGLYPGTVSLRPSTGDVSYDIPLGATRGITETFKQFRDLIPKQSSPAAVRANTLAAKENRDRTVQTGVCRDPYWNEANLGKIYPWATFQFLSIKDWKTLADERSVMFHDDWTNFLGRLESTYKSAPKFNRPTGAKFLNQMKFSNMNKNKLCEKGTEVSVRFKEVQDGLLSLQGLHERHVAAMWGILNSLIIVIEDPDTKSEIVRLHPNIVAPTATMSSKQYVEEQAAKARGLLAEFYSSVEEVYMRAVENMVPV